MTKLENLIEILGLKVPECKNEEFFIQEAETTDPASKKKVIPPFLFIKRFLGSHLAKMRYYSQINTFFVYDIKKGLWLRLEPRTFEKLFQQLILNTPIGSQQPTAKYAKQLVEELSGTEIHRMGVPHFDDNYICLKNTLVNTVSGKTENFNPKVFMINQTPYRYDASATCPKFQEFISTFCSNFEDRVALLKAWMRVVLAGSKSAQVFLYILGPGSTGKSVFANTLVALVGKDRVIQTTLKNLNTDVFELYNLIGKPLIMISDSELYTGDLSLLKQIVGNDKIQGRAKYVQGTFDIKKTGNVMIVANVLFSNKDQSTAVTRRLLPFIADNITNKRELLIEPDSSEIGFNGVLSQELSGILNWVLECSLDEALDYLINPVSKVPSLGDFINNSKNQVNPLAMWVQSRIEYHEGGEVLVGTKTSKLLAENSLYQDYTQFNKSYGENSVKPYTFVLHFTNYLASLGYKDVVSKRTNRGLVVVNVKFKS